ncbi:hypothetical protein [Bradyrhizobium iriomotense]|uniref:hypothetical protein n=1 Tax=Bradyrhizobium iriomotense TaxID=441950 RepID=UPI0024E0A017|nr:hypothetical protein [Bradyrhizobium iriomotense]
MVTVQAVAMASRADEQYRGSHSAVDLGLVMAEMVEMAEARAAVATGETAETPVP